MSMGTVGRRSNGVSAETASDSAHHQQHSQHSQHSPTAYTNGNYVHYQWDSIRYPSDQTLSHQDDSSKGDYIPESRPISQGAVSLQSRPNSQGVTNGPPTPATPTRPNSNGTDLAQPPAMRHGFADAYSSEEYLHMLEQVHFSNRDILISGVLHVLHLRPT